MAGVSGHGNSGLLHIGSSSSTPLTRPEHRPDVMIAITPRNSYAGDQRPDVDAIFGKFPGLKIAVSEGRASDGSSTPGEHWTTWISTSRMDGGRLRRFAAERRFFLFFFSHRAHIVDLFHRRTASGLEQASPDGVDSITWECVYPALGQHPGRITRAAVQSLHGSGRRARQDAHRNARRCISSIRLAASARGKHVAALRRGRVNVDTPSQVGRQIEGGVKADPSFAAIAGRRPRRLAGWRRALDAEMDDLPSRADGSTPAPPDALLAYARGRRRQPVEASSTLPCLDRRQWQPAESSGGPIAGKCWPSRRSRRDTTASRVA